MFETLDKLVAAGLGALTMTREKAEEMFDEAVRRGQEQRGNQRQFVEDMMDSASKARTRLEEVIAEQVRAALVALNVPTRDDLARIEAKLDLLLARQPMTPAGDVTSGCP